MTKDLTPDPVVDRLRDEARWSATRIARETGIPITPADVARTLSIRAGCFPGRRLSPAEEYCLRLDFVESCRVWCELRGRDPGPDPTTTVRMATSTAEGFASLLDAGVGAALSTGFATGADTTTGWTAQIAVPDFHEVEAFVLDAAGRIEVLPRGAAPADFSVTVRAEDWRVHRYASRFVIDEQDILDAPRRLSAILRMVESMGRAAAMIRPDLVYSAILANASLSDDIALFDAADHGNAGTAALADSSLYAALSAIGNQVLTTATGEPVHPGARGKYLIVPPDLCGTARELARAIALGDDDDLEVRAESRISTTSVVRPSDGAPFTGSATNWMLAARASDVPCIIVGARGGQFSPLLRSRPLTRGGWGVEYTIHLDIGAAAVNYPGLYFSTGAG